MRRRMHSHSPLVVRLGGAVSSLTPLSIATATQKSSYWRQISQHALGVTFHAHSPTLDARFLWQ